MSGTGRRLGRRGGGIRLLRALLVASLLVLVGFTWLPAGPARADDPPPTGLVRLVGGHLERDGVPWVPRGATFLAVLAPDGVSHGITTTAASWFGPSELAAARAWGMDVVRFQVSQPGLDPQDSLHSDSYRDRVVAAVALARSSGFSVILSMQDQDLAGGNADPQPSAATARAWDVLAGLYGTDSGVLFELFNEPQNAPDDAGWRLWRDGDGTATAVGHQALVSRLRADGAGNVLLADGARFAHVLTGVPELDDPLGQTGYAVHPYLWKETQQPDSWDAAFGFAVDRVGDPLTVVATEWNAWSDTGACKPEWGTNAPLLVQYLRAHGIGLIGWPFDAPGYLVTGSTWTPTVLTNFSCSTAHLGAGTLIRDEFLRDDPPALRVLQPTDGTVVSGGSVPVDVRTADDGGAVDVQVSVDGQPLASTGVGEVSAAWDASSAAEGEHRLRVVATDGAGQSTTVERSILVRRGAPAPPDAPTGVVASAPAPTRVDLSWNPVTPGPGVLPIAGYQVFRNASSTPIASVSDPAWSDTSVRPGTRYSYTVRSFDAGAPPTYGPPSAVAAVTTPADRPPAVRGALAVSGTTPTSVSLVWNAATDDHGLAGYRVYRDGTQVGAPTVPWFVDSGLRAGTAHAYTVAAVDSAAQLSTRSPKVPATTPGNPSGLLGTYGTASDGLAAPRMVRIDPTVAFSWGAGAPTRAVPADDVDVRWTGSLRSPATGRYTLTVTADDGARLWVDGALVLDRWTAPGSGGVVVRLTAGRATAIRLEMQDRSGTATARLAWSGPGVTSGTIPSARLHP